MSLGHLIGQYDRPDTLSFESDDEITDEVLMDLSERMSLESAGFYQAQLQLHTAVKLHDSGLNDTDMVATLESLGAYTQENIVKKAWDGLIALLKKLWEHAVRLAQASKEFFLGLGRRTKRMKSQLEGLKKESSSYKSILQKKVPISPLHAPRLQVDGNNPTPDELAKAFENYASHSQSVVDAYLIVTSDYQKHILGVVNDLNNGRHLDMMRSMEEAERYIDREAGRIFDRIDSTTIPMPAIERITATYYRSATAHSLVDQVNPIQITMSESKERPQRETAMPISNDIPSLIRSAELLIEQIEQIEKVLPKIMEKQREITLGLKTITDKPEQMGENTEGLSRFANAVKTVNSLDGSIKDISRTSWKQLSTLIYYIDACIATSSGRRKSR